MKGKAPVKPQLRPRFRVVCGDDIALGPGKVALLDRLRDTGSLNEAARQLGMSYMRAWSLVQTMNTCFREPVVTAARGGHQRGGMQLTDTGKQILALYHEMEAAAKAATLPQWRALQRRLRA